MRNFYVAAGFNSGGIANAGGAGMALAEWITAGEPTMDLSSVDIRRFSPHHNNKRFLQECVKETLSWHYLLRFPYSERMRARRIRCSPLYSDLDTAGASWGDRMGWEVAKWFSLPGQGTRLPEVAMLLVRNDLPILKNLYRDSKIPLSQSQFIYSRRKRQ